jgi:TIR domain
MGNHIFISYAHKDQSFAHCLATRLKSRGAPIWLDQWDIPAGANWNQSIDKALYDCSQFLIVLSPAAVASSQVQGELQMALDEHKSIVPVLHQACQVPRLLRSIQYVDFTGCSPDDVPTLERLASALRLPETGRLSQREPPVSNKSSSLWRYGTVGSVLLLGLLIAWLWLRPPTQLDTVVPPAKLDTAVPLPPSARPIAVREDEARKVSVYIGTQPSGVSVYRDGRLVATTPWQFDAPVGSHVRAVLKGEGLEDREIDFWVNNYKNVYSYRMDKRSGR